jgi:hypothetical protein
MLSVFGGSFYLHLRNFYSISTLPNQFMVSKLLKNKYDVYMPTHSTHCKINSRSVTLLE